MEHSLNMSTYTTIKVNIDNTDINFFLGGSSNDLFAGRGCGQPTRSRGEGQGQGWHSWDKFRKNKRTFRKGLQESSCVFNVVS